jgi:hypothetical protein
MAFLAPFTLLALLLVSLPVLIHLLVRRRGRRLDFPSLKFLRETPSFKLYPRRIRQALLLALRAAAIILLVTGLARPLLTFRARKPERVRFILLDASLSMRMRGRAEAAREQARAILNKLASGERACVIALSSEALSLTELTANREKLLEAIARYEPTGGPVNYSAGLKEIERRIKEEPQISAEADIISDFQASGLEGEANTLSALRVAATAPLRITVYPVGSTVERNAFWVDEAAEKNERGVELHASEIISADGGRAGARRVWTIGGSDSTAPGIEWRTEKNGQITGRLKTLGPDDFDADDERFFAFAPPGSSRVLLIEDGSEATPYLRAALEAAASEHGTASYALDRRPGLPESADALAAYSLVVVTLRGDAFERQGQALMEYARAGGTVWMFLARDLDAASLSRLAKMDAEGMLPFESVERRSGNQSLRLGAMDSSAPQLRALDESARAALSAVRVHESYTVTPRPSAHTLIRWSNSEPAFIYGRAGEGLILLLATSPERGASELGLSPAFPALASSILSATVAARSFPLSQTIGEAVRLKVTPETEVKITNERGLVQTATARELVRRPLSHFTEPGIYQLEYAGQEKFLAFNAPVAESERALATAQELKLRFGSNEEASAKAAIDTGSLREALERGDATWRYLLAAAFLLTIAELFVSIRQRKALEG